MQKLLNTRVNPPLTSGCREGKHPDVQITNIRVFSIKSHYLVENKRYALYLFSAVLEKDGVIVE